MKLDDLFVHVKQESYPHLGHPGDRLEDQVQKPAVSARGDRRLLGEEEENEMFSEGEEIDEMAGGNEAEVGEESANESIDVNSFELTEEEMMALQAPDIPEGEEHEALEGLTDLESGEEAGGGD